MQDAERILEEARRAGIDLQMIETKLSLSYEQRALRHEAALEVMRAMREAGAQLENAVRPSEATG